MKIGPSLRGHYLWLGMAWGTTTMILVQLTTRRLGEMEYDVLRMKTINAYSVLCIAYSHVILHSLYNHMIKLQAIHVV